MSATIRKPVQQSLPPMTIPGLTNRKKAIILRHLNILSEESWEQFKTALCNLKPPHKAAHLKMAELNGRTKMYVVGIIFSRYTETYGPGKIKSILKDIGENEMLISVERELRKLTSKKRTRNANRGAGPRSAPKRPEQGKQVCEKKDRPGPTKRIRTSPSAGSVKGPVDTQQNLTNGTSHEANKTKKSPDQVVSQRCTQGNVSSAMDSDEMFLLLFAKKMKEIPPENKEDVQIEILKIFKKYSKLNVSQTSNTTAMPMQLVNDAGLLGSSPRSPTLHLSPQSIRDE